MNKILIFLLSFMLLSTPQEIFKDNFLSDVDKAYSEYTVITNYTNETYSLHIVKGIINNQATYGVSFFNIRAGDYNLFFEIDGIEYKVKPDGRGDYRLIGIKWRNYEQIKIKIYSKDGNLQSPAHLTVLDKFDKSTFVGDIIGQDEGKTLVSLERVDSVLNFDAFAMVTLAIIGVCALVIAIFAITKKGMFSKEVRKESVFDFKEFINQQTTTPQNNDDWIEVVPEVEEVQKDSQESPKEVYEKAPRYVDDEISSIDVKKHLQDAGFVVDYSLVGDEEKNLIMLELMHLKNEGKISNDVYLEEIYKLWKK